MGRAYCDRTRSLSMWYILWCHSPTPGTYTSSPSIYGNVWVVMISEFSSVCLSSVMERCWNDILCIFFCRDDCIWVSISTRSFFTHSICCEHVNIKKHKHMLLHWMQHWVRRRKCHKKNHLTQANNQTLLLRFKSFNTSLSGFEMSFSFRVFHSKEHLICIIIMALFSKNWSTCSSQGKIGDLTFHGFLLFFSVLKHHEQLRQKHTFSAEWKLKNWTGLELWIRQTSCHWVLLHLMRNGYPRRQ